MWRLSNFISVCQHCSSHVWIQCSLHHTNPQAASPTRWSLAWLLGQGNFERYVFYTISLLYRNCLCYLTRRTLRTQQFASSNRGDFVILPTYTSHTYIKCHKNNIMAHSLSLHHMHGIRLRQLKLVWSSITTVKQQQQQPTDILIKLCIHLRLTTEWATGLTVGGVLEMLLLLFL